MAITRKDIRRRLGEAGFMGDMLVSTVTAGGAATLDDTKLTQGANFFNRAEILVNTGPAAGDIRVVTGWDGVTNHRFTVDSNWTGVPLGGNEYEIHSQFGVRQKNEAIKNAILMAKLRWPRIVEDETLVQTLGQYGYLVSGLTIPIDRTIGLDSVQYEEPGLTATQLWPSFDRSAWDLRYSGATMTLQFRVQVPHPTLKMRLNYRTVPPVLTDDVTALDPDDSSLSDFIVTYAAYLLCAARSLEEREDTVKGPWIVKGAEFKTDALKMLVQDKPHKRPGEVIFSTWGSDVHAQNDRRINVSVGRVRL